MLMMLWIIIFFIRIEEEKQLLSNLRNIPHAHKYLRKSRRQMQRSEVLRSVNSNFHELPDTQHFESLYNSLFKSVSKKLVLNRILRSWGHTRTRELINSTWLVKSLPKKFFFAGPYERIKPKCEWERNNCKCKYFSFASTNHSKQRNLDYITFW